MGDGPAGHANRSATMGMSGWLRRIGDEIEPDLICVVPVRFILQSG
jgi:hypothetical protein